MKKLLIGLTLLASISSLASEDFSRRGNYTNKGCSIFSACGKAESIASDKARKDCQDFAKKNNININRCVKKDASVFSKGTASSEMCFNPLASHEAFCSMTVEFIIN